ncbi:MAG: hypothetical protein LBD51_01315 [Bifidobacteriaceae bacterium]|jgi:hypothetical protein|nr:hypothetical protein [Bifidobacteriaceae bacterium]
MKKLDMSRLAAAGLGGLLLCGVGGMAFADPEFDDEAVAVMVEIDPLDTGVLSMSAASNQTSLAERTSADSSLREFAGVLPDVTVSDTRTNVPAGVGWYVLGTATAFQGDGTQPDIPAANLGWEPILDDAVDPGSVAAGDLIGTALDAVPGRGLAGGADPGGGELFAWTDDSAAIAHEGSWTARANLVLKTPASIAPGDYQSVLTLTLFESEE